MGKFKFYPKVGMKTLDSYLHGVGLLDDINCEGIIEVVGVDYFVLRNKYRDTVRLVEKNQYWVIEENDFTED